MEPLSIGVSALMQRMKVDLPEPDGPMMQTTSPFISSSEMPLSTSRLPNDLCTSRQRMMGSAGVQAERVIASFAYATRVFGVTLGLDPRVQGQADKRTPWMLG